MGLQPVIMAAQAIQVLQDGVVSVAHGTRWAAARTRAHSSRNSRIDARPALVTNRSSAAGSTAAASAIAVACAVDSFPCRNASDVPGSASNRCDAVTSAWAAPVDVPDVRASHWAADR
jgi:hypothetical protein